jgi:hypothetical protein
MAIDLLTFRHLLEKNAMRDWFSKGAIHIEPPEARGMQRDNELRRLTIGGGIKLLIYFVRKQSVKATTISPQQSDYQHTWNETEQRNS